MRYMLIGNPNVGKTTLFNNLTGSNAHVGNWSGVTVDKLEGSIKQQESVPEMSARLLSKMDMWSDRNIRKNRKRKNGRQVHFK